MKKLLVSMFVTSLFLISSCSDFHYVTTAPTVGQENSEETSKEIIPNDQKGEIDLENVDEHSLLGKYDFGTLNLSKDLDQLGIESIEPIYFGSNWYELKLKNNIKSFDIIEKVRELNIFSLVDYNYLVKTQVIEPGFESWDNGNPGMNNQQKYLKQIGLDKLWKYMDKNSPLDEFGNPITGAGGSKDVIVAVVDTGVDYTHPDIRENIWTNFAEIPDNGIDDDGNGYIDDYYGWNAVEENGDPMDDHGHGTHCAGIIGMQNNKIGGIGVAYNCRIMAVKCGDSSGAFTSADMAEAITYAYMNGADIISMSVAGPDLSIAVQEAVENAYNSTLLVAAAGNEALKNEPAYPGDPQFISQYPASYPYVLGVMSADADNNLSYFSNWDTFHDNNVEYEIAAPGEAIYSTFPNNRYTSLNGTSMATPVVAGVAALLRSMYPDKDAYPTSFLMSQITETADMLTSYGMGYTTYPGVINAYNAIVNTPKPTVSLYDYYAFDDKSFAPENNGDGAIDAGETIHIGVALKNRGGAASNVEPSINTLTVDGSTDPYIEIINDKIDYPDIGTYSIREPEKIYSEDGAIVDVENAFVIKVKEDIPDNYNIVLNLQVSYRNGLDSEDQTIYQLNADTMDGQTDLVFTAHQGQRLPRRISEDTLFKKGVKYILAENMVIDEGVTCTFEAGSEIEVYEGESGYYDTVINSPAIINHGNLIFEGTSEDRIKIKPSEKFEFEQYIWSIINLGKTEFYYSDVTNLRTYPNGTETPETKIDKIDHCNFITDRADYTYINGESKAQFMALSAIEATHTIFSGEDLCEALEFKFDYLDSCTINVLKSKPTHYPYPGLYNIHIYNKAQNNIFIQQKEFDRNDNSNGDYDPIYIHLHETVTAFDNNTFINEYDENEIPLGKSIHIYVDSGCVADWYGNNFTGLYSLFIDRLVFDYTNGNGSTIVKYHEENQDLSKQMPFIVDIQIFDSNDNEVTTVSREEVTYLVTFNRDMEQTDDISVMFGPRRPYADYKINGEWVDARHWKGTYQITSLIANGTQHFRITGAHAVDDPGMELAETGARFSFDVNIALAESMNLFATPTSEGMELSWIQDDFEEVMGYNIYRSEYRDGQDIRINPTLVSKDENTYIDIDAEPGKTYWYSFTIITTDMKESSPSPDIMATMVDSEAPNVYHTPVNQAYVGNDLVITCSASDNIDVEELKLYYRLSDEETYSSITMTRNNDRFSARISGGNISGDYLEYYITASDGVNTISKGSADEPYHVIIKDASLLSGKGDVNGDSVIDTLDAQMMMDSVTGKINLTDDQFKRADIDGDEKINAKEIYAVLQYINGNINSFDNVIL